MWTEILVALGGTTALLTAVAWLVRSIVLHLLSKDVEKFKHDLQNRSSRELEQLKHSLQLQAAQFKTQWDLLHARRAEVVAELYCRLVEFVEAAESLAALPKAEERDKKERSKAFWDKASAVQTYYTRNRIYFSPDTCQKVDALFRKITDSSRSFMYWLAEAERTRSEVESIWRKFDLAWGRASRVMEEDAPLLMSTVEEEFRSLLGVVPMPVGDTD